MQLNMYIDDVLVDSVPVFASSDNKVHVEVFRHQLLQKHSDRLEMEDSTPTFTLEGVPSRANQKFTSLATQFDQFSQESPLYPKSIRHKE